MKPADKHFRCTVCQRGFTRIDHLKRHHLRHSGQKPYSCVFCNEAFARCDNLRDHYADCAQRGDRKIPDTGQRGRRRHACESCTSMKLRCDGQSPCGSCEKRGLECNNERTTNPKHPGLEEGMINSNGVETIFSQPAGSSPTRTGMYEQPSDRGSIKFLLNGGTDSFTERFRLPPRSDRARGLEFHNQSGIEEAANGQFPYNVPNSRSDYTPALMDSDPAALQFFQDTFLDFFNGPFGDGSKPLDDPFGGQMGYPNAVTSATDPNLAVSPVQAIFEPERPFSMALIQSILARAWTVPLDAKAQEEISANLNFLLTTARIRKFTTLYFRYWQPNCPLVHGPSFDPETVSLPLLASVVFMGAMYSNDQRELYIAKRVLDFAELFIFSSHVYSPECEVATIFLGNQTSDDQTSDSTKFQSFQAGFIITVVQYWAGSRPSRNRAMENRFSEVVKVARRMNLMRCRHTSQDQTEHQWLETECRIRTVNIISLLDCAFFFYQNYPCRLTHAELECELPCEDSIFRSAHPFSEPRFRLSRSTTTYATFQNLFETPSNESPFKTKHTDLTVLDMFILIHILFAFINTHMTLVGLLKRQAQILQSQNTPHESNSAKSMIPEDCLLSSIRTALNSWREHWVALRNQVSSDEWASMGFYKNGYNFWLVSQLLITKKDAVDVIMQMEVKCEDKLEKLKVLLHDEQGEQD